MYTHIPLTAPELPTLQDKYVLCRGTHQYITGKIVGETEQAFVLKDAAYVYNTGFTQTAAATGLMESIADFPSLQPVLVMKNKLVDVIELPCKATMREDRAVASYADWAPANVVRTDHPLAGKLVSLWTDTMVDQGILLGETEHFYVLGDAEWVADTGILDNYSKTGVADDSCRFSQPIYVGKATVSPMFELVKWGLAPV
jgi:hypothetical protein